MTIEEAKKHIADLSDKAAKAGKSEDAIRYSQAACNVANALCALGSANEAK